MKIKIVLWIILILSMVLIFKKWFGLVAISRGDLTYFFKEMSGELLSLPMVWSPFMGNGLGGVNFFSLGNYVFNLPQGFLSIFLDYGLVQRIIWFCPILFFGVISPFLLSRELNLFPFKFYPLSSLIFLLNTYFLMIIGGGQITVALGFVTTYLCFYLFLRSLEKTNLKNVILFSLGFSLLLAFDFRFPYLLLLIIGVYFVFQLFVHRFLEWFKIFKIFFLILFPASVITGLVHSFWLLPLILIRFNPTSSASEVYTTAEAVNFFSFAKLENSFSFLHPNWPEDIFGKTYFMKWEFLILPILAYVSLLFTSFKKMRKENIYVLFFAVLGLTGVFLAKGSNPPLGEVYLWLFAHIPGFVMFRDPTKFYTLIAISYSVLIPYNIWKIYEWLTEKLKNKKTEKLLTRKIFKFMPSGFLFLAIASLLILIKPAWMGELGGTFKPKDIPPEYVILKNFIANQPEFFRTFWIPTKQRFTFYTDNHPAIDSTYFLNKASSSGVINRLQDKKTQELLVRAGVKYLILPYDSEGEIFLKDRVYDESQRQKLERELDKITWLKKIQLSNLDNQIKTVIYETQEFNDHFRLENNGEVSSTKLQWKMINPTKYSVLVENLTSPTTLVFSETFNHGWIAKVNGEQIISQKTDLGFNSFFILKAGDYKLTIEFTLQKYTYLGIIISSLTLLTIILILIVSSRKKTA